MRRLFAASAAALALFAAGCEENITAPRNVACEPFLLELQPFEADTMQSPIGASYLEVRTGSGMVADFGFEVDVNYSLYDLEENRIDSSCPLERTITRFTLGTNQILPGFQDGVLGMREGGIRRVILPEELGYELLPDGSNEAVADKVLVFDIHLVEVRRR